MRVFGCGRGLRQQQCCDYCLLSELCCSGLRGQNPRILLNVDLSGPTVRETFPLRRTSPDWRSAASTQARSLPSIRVHLERFCRKTPSSARERAVFSPGKDGEAGDVCLIVDTAGCSQVDNSGCLDPTVNRTVQEKGPLEARSGFPTEPSIDCSFHSSFQCLPLLRKSRLKKSI